MGEKVSAIWEKIKTFVGSLSKTAKIFIVIALLAICIIFFARWLIISSKPFEVVFYDLTNADLQIAASYLVENGWEDYKIDGNDILVPEGLADRARASLYMAGVLQSGTSYQTYTDMVGPMSTDTDKEIAYLHDLQKSLGGTIRNFDGVQDAIVYISQGEDRRYILDSTNIVKSTASVSITLSSNQMLTKEVAAAVRTAVSSAVADLDFEYVSVYDNMGNTYSDLDSSHSAIVEASYAKMQLEEDANNRIRSELMWGLGALYGTDDVRISVNTVVDIDRAYSVSTEYPAPEYGLTGEEDPRGPISSESWNGYFYGSDGVGIGGVVGASPNADFPMYPADADGDGVLDYYGGSSGQVDYLAPEIVTQKEQLAGTVVDVVVGVTVNSDYQSTVSVAEIVNYVAVVANVPADLVDEKVTVMMAPFRVIDAAEEDAAKVGSWIWFAILAGLALFLIVVIIIIIFVRKKKREEEEAALVEEEEERRRVEAERAAEEIAALAPVDGADIMDVNTEKSMELRKDLRTFVGNNPEIAASLLRNLMKGGEIPDAS